MTGKRTLKRLQRRLQRHAPLFPLSTTGLIVLVIASASLYGLGYQRMDLVVFALAVCALVITLAAMALTTITGQVLKRRQRLAQDTPPATGDLRMESGYPNESGYTRPAMPWLPLVSLHWRVIHPDAITTRIRISSDGRYQDEELTPRRRCLSSQVTRRFTVSDVLGLARHSWTQTTPTRIMALPAKGPIRQLPLLRSLSAEDGIPDPAGQPVGDRMEIRPYTPGDPVRHIMWNVYARNRQLNIRLEERSVFDSQRTLAYLISADEDEAAAAAARIAIDSGALGVDWLFGADGSRTVTADRHEALELVCASRPLDANVTDTQGSGLDAFLESTDSQRSHCIVFAPAVGGPWIGALQRAAASHRGQFSVILGTDGFRNEDARPWLRRLLYRDTREDGRSDGGQVSSIMQLRRTLEQIRPVATQVMVVDRNTGQSFDRGLNRV